MRVSIRTLSLCLVTALLTLVGGEAYRFNAEKLGYAAEAWDYARGEREARAQFARGEGFQVTNERALWNDCCGGSWLCDRDHTARVDPERYGSCRLNIVRNCVLIREIKRRYDIEVFRPTDYVRQGYELGRVLEMDRLVWNEMAQQIDSLQMQVRTGRVASGPECARKAEVFDEQMRVASARRGW